MKLLKGHISGNSYTIEKELRQAGKFSKVWLGSNITNGQKVVIKELHTKDEIVPAELKIPLVHPAILRATDYSQSEKTYLIVPYVDAIESRTYFKKHKKAYDEILDVAKQISHALMSLSEKNWLHLDVKPDNILVNKECHGKPKAYLIDFGMAKRPDEINGRMPFSLAYAAPERILQMHEFVGLHSDIYSLALCMYEWCTGEVPHYHSNPELMMQLRITQPLALQNKIPELLAQLIISVGKPLNIKKPFRMYTEDERLAIFNESISNRARGVEKWLSYIDR